MKKIFVSLLLIASVVAFQYCSSTKKNAAPKVVPLNYQSNILPVIENSCSPCHISGKGNKLPLNNYTAASEYVDDIISRIQKNPNDKGFMPMKHAKLSDSTINLFVKWKADGLKEK